MNNQNSTVGPVGFVFLVLILVMNWAIWLGKWLNDVGQIAITTSGMTGVEAWFYANLNLFFWISLILGITAYLYFGGGK